MFINNLSTFLLGIMGLTKKTRASSNESFKSLWENGILRLGPVDVAKIHRE